MDESVLKSFYDALIAARAIEHFACSRSFEDFLNDDMLASAIERKFEIIGEALVRIRRIDPNALEWIDQWPAIIGFRNLLAHAYDHVEPTVVWGIVTAQIPGFIIDIESIPGLGNSEDDKPPTPPGQAQKIKISKMGDRRWDIEDGRSDMGYRRWKIPRFAGLVSPSGPDFVSPSGGVYGGVRGCTGFRLRSRDGRWEPLTSLFCLEGRAGVGIREDCEPFDF